MRNIQIKNETKKYYHIYTYTHKKKQNKKDKEIKFFFCQNP